jgi:hypothetical protein
LQIAAKALVFIDFSNALYIYINQTNKKMKFKIVICLLVFFTFSVGLKSSYAQDLIVTERGDSIKCQIKNISNEKIFFTFIFKDQVQSTSLPLEQVHSHTKDYYGKPLVPDKIESGEKSFPYFRLALNGGYSRRIAKIGENVPVYYEDYVTGLRPGFHYGLDMTFYTTETFGLGVKGLVSHHNNFMDNVNLRLPNGLSQYGEMGDNIMIYLLAPAMSIRVFDMNTKNALVMNVGMGYLGYHNDVILIDDYDIDGGTVGFAFDFGYDISISENLAIGLQMSMVIGSITKFNLSDGNTSETIELEPEDYENLSRLDLTIGLRFNK